MGGRETVEYAAEGRSDPSAAGEGSVKSERADANKSDKRSTGASEGHGVDVGKHLMRAAGAGARGAGGGKGEETPGRGSPNSIVG